MITDLSIGKLLIAGVIPVILTILANMLVSYFSAIINPKLAPRGPKTSLREKISSMSGLWGFIILIGANRNNANNFTYCIPSTFRSWF